MKITSFKYTKADGKVSNRVVLVVSEPSNMLKGIDISELTDEEQGRFIADASKAYEDYLKVLAFVQLDHDVVHNFRQFDPLKMTEVTSEQA